MRARARRVDASAGAESSWTQGAAAAAPGGAADNACFLTALAGDFPALPVIEKDRSAGQRRAVRRPAGPRRHLAKEPPARGRAVHRLPGRAVHRLPGRRGHVSLQRRLRTAILAASTQRACFLTRATGRGRAAARRRASPPSGGPWKLLGALQPGPRFGEAPCVAPSEGAYGRAESGSDGRTATSVVGSIARNSLSSGRQTLSKDHA